MTKASSIPGFPSLCSFASDNKIPRLAAQRTFYFLAVLEFWSPRLSCLAGSVTSEWLLSMAGRWSSMLTGPSFCVHTPWCLFLFLQGGHQSYRIRAPPIRPCLNLTPSLPKFPSSIPLNGLFQEIHVLFELETHRVNSGKAVTIRARDC